MSDPKQGDPPEYKVYRSRKNPLQRLSGGTDLDALKRRLSRARRDELLNLLDRGCPPDLAARILDE